MGDASKIDLYAAKLSDPKLGMLLLSNTDLKAERH